MEANHLVSFLNQLENSGLLSEKVNRKIQDFLDFGYRENGKLFLVLSAIIGALFASAGIFAIISHNWDDLPKVVRGIMSLIPSLVALYFFYVAVFKKKTTVWREASSLFLFLMIGASIALI